MNWKTKVVSIAGTMVVGVAGFAPATVWAATSTNNSYSHYKTEITQLKDSLKTLEATRKTDNQELTALFKQSKATMAKKHKPTTWNAVKTTHAEIVAVRTRLETDVKNTHAARIKDQWAKYVTDLKDAKYDLQTLVNLKVRQLHNLSDLNLTGAPSGVNTDGSDPTSSNTANT
ncbi:hypothetical protein NZD89_24760 [Alicyclobacillus fastidiosus]|uniref:DUF5082 domain-containing protein n=1 Tax=Alicyclobacillus fastidiosus TaxID=392011 RepID=A0ABY6ZEU6_9BACL|nr:hypothetical protein [Alicyclobacillus fastidiosus]WAH41419.1 hypothetical protein NZD89_24760 [Alicyclobacillus fastidiosus]GMA63042.1 hypothetical protein GCM10025859_34820 [Alicyclobacillus fastidiosus]